MPEFDRINDQNYYIEVINRGTRELAYRFSAQQEWIKLSATKGKTRYSEKIYVTIDWSKVPAGNHVGKITLAGAGAEYRIHVPVQNARFNIEGFVENGGIVSIEAANFQKSTPAHDASWITVPNLGRTHSAVMPFPTDAVSRNLAQGAPTLEYTFTLLNENNVEILTYLSPSHNFAPGDGLRFAIAVDDNEPQVININHGEDLPDWKYAAWWTKAVGDHIKIRHSNHSRIQAGVHRLLIWMIDPGVVLQKFVLNAGGLRDSYLSPPESIFVKKE